MPPPALVGFLALLVALMAASCVVGRAAGPVAPGIHRSVPEDGGAGGMDTHGMGTRGRGVP
ncbi:hypothetical protein NQU54_13360 [Streptomyces samsunensis]|uniref:Uncharacterized protein n=1 Tax=Streptomyces malaysiensis subsp. samsunensis TaxID=459658 RepID=A0A9X2RVB8_STRMQ|nr:hypothetical protein [Streptomyces samsunensis]